MSQHIRVVHSALMPRNRLKIYYFIQKLLCYLITLVMTAGLPHNMARKSCLPNFNVNIILNK